MEIIGSLRFYVDYMRGKPFTHSSSKGPDDDEGRKKDFGEAFGITTSKQPMPVQQMAPEVPTEEAVLLGPYPFASTADNGHV